MIMKIAILSTDPGHPVIPHLRAWSARMVAQGHTVTLAHDKGELTEGDVLFLVSCLSSYWALRTRNIHRMHRVERFADTVFIIALVLMAFICGFITYSIAAF